MSVTLIAFEAVNIMQVGKNHVGNLFQAALHIIMKMSVNLVAVHMSKVIQYAKQKNQPQVWKKIVLVYFVLKKLLVPANSSIKTSRVVEFLPPCLHP